MQLHYLYPEQVYHRFDFAKEADALLHIGQRFLGDTAGRYAKSQATIMGVR
jgi:hypothetical protein